MTKEEYLKKRKQFDKVEQEYIREHAKFEIGQIVTLIGRKRREIITDIYVDMYGTIRYDTDYKQSWYLTEELELYNEE